MQNTEVILSYSTVVLVGISFLVVGLRGGLNAFLAVFGGSDFKFRYDFSKQKLLTVAIAIAGIAFVSFIFGMAIGGAMSSIGWFCLSNALFVGLAIFMSVCLVPKEKK